MGNSSNKEPKRPIIRPQCKKIYDDYCKCYNIWKENTDFMEYYREGKSPVCTRMYMDFQMCLVDQVLEESGKTPEKLLKLKNEMNIKMNELQNEANEIEQNLQNNNEEDSNNKLEDYHPYKKYKEHQFAKPPRKRKKDDKIIE